MKELSMAKYRIQELEKCSGETVDSFGSTDKSAINLSLGLTTEADNDRGKANRAFEALMQT